jgi:hypothetical protein
LLKGKVNGHLVTIEVGIERRTCQWMQLDSFTLDHLRLESLNTETVQCRGTVEEYWMSFHYVLKNIPDDRFLTVDNLLRALDRLNDTAFDEVCG